MKKPLTAMLSALLLALSAQADVTFPYGTSFENFTEGQELDLKLGDDGRRENCHWWGIDRFSTETKIKAYEGDAYPAARPEQFSASGQNLYLSIDGTDKIYRTIDANSGEKPFRAVGIDDGFYCDMLVKFSVGPRVQEDEPDDKLVVWVQQREADGSGAGATNLMIEAGYVMENGQTRTNSYAVTALGGVPLPGAFDFSAWHRLTVKAIEEITIDPFNGAAGFVVFIDGQLATCTAPRGDEGSYFDELNPLARKWAEKGGLYPSRLSARRVGSQSLAAVCFVGCGAVDDLSFTRVAPAFAGDTRGLTVIRGDEKVTSVTYTVNSGTPASVVFDAEGVANLQLGTADSYQVALAANYADGYGRGAWTFDGEPTDEASFRITGSGTVVVRSASVREVCEIGSVRYGSLDAAFAAVPYGGRATIKLLADIGSEAYGAVDMETEITLDLAGHTITGGDFKYAIGGVRYTAGTVIDNFGKLRIVDTSAGRTGRVKVTDPSFPCIWTSGDSALAIEAGTYDGLIEDGCVAAAGERPAAIQLGGGSFKSPDGANFYLADAVVEGCSASYSGGYWVVSGSPAFVPMSMASSAPVPASSVEWDIPASGTAGGINAFAGANGRPYVQFTALEVAEDTVRARIRAKAIDADGGVFAVVFKTGFAKDAAVIRRNGVLAACAPGANGEVTEAVITIERDAELAKFQQLFAVGLASVEPGE